MDAWAVFRQMLCWRPTQSNKDDINVHLQTLRILTQERPSAIDPLLTWESDNARLRHATVQAVWQTHRSDLAERLVELAARETDRVVFYSTWNALNELISADELKALIKDPSPRVRLASLLALFLSDGLTADEVLAPAHGQRPVKSPAWLKCGFKKLAMVPR